MGALFFDTVALKVVHVFEIADREVRTWMNGFIRPLEARLNAFQEQANGRIEGMGRIQGAETDLVARTEQLRQLAAEVAAQLREWELHHAHLTALVESKPEKARELTAALESWESELMPPLWRGRPGFQAGGARVAATRPAAAGRRGNRAARRARQGENAAQESE